MSTRRAFAAMANRDGHDLMLAVAEPGVELVPNARHDRWDLEYGMREIEVLSPDGHLVCLGQDHVRRPDDEE